MRLGRYSVSMICSRYRGVHAASAAAGLCYNNAKYTKTRSCTRSGHARSRCVFYTVYRYFYYFFLFAKLFQHEEYITKKYSLSVIVGHSYLHEYNINNARNSKYYINRDNILVIFRKKKNNKFPLLSPRYRKSLCYTRIHLKASAVSPYIYREIFVFSYARFK